MGLNLNNIIEKESGNEKNNVIVVNNKIRCCEV